MFFDYCQMSNVLVIVFTMKPIKSICDLLKLHEYIEASVENDEADVRKDSGMYVFN